MTDSHPSLFLKKIFQKEGASFTFSKYTYQPDTLFDEREVISVNGTDISEKWIQEITDSLRSDQELAISSLVKIRGKSFHIPMIDLATSQLNNQDIFSRLTRYISKSVTMNMSFYASGRSFHAYSTTLLTPKEWISFMGRLLLINSKNNPEIIDSRWIGHRLIGGYGSLRWSNNSGQYLAAPRAVKFP